MSFFENMECALVHIHIFKNAGTSLDVVLKNYFGEKYKEYDKPDPEGYISVNETANLIQANPGHVCFASHQIYLPMPIFQTKFVIPLFFLRNPIARVQSCFHFERDVQGNYDPDTTLEQYVRRLLDDPKINAIISLQTAMLCDSRYIFQDRSKNKINQRVLETALNHLDTYHSFGIVEHFKESLQLIDRKLNPYMPGIKLSTEEAMNVRVNTTVNKDLKVDEKVRYVKDSLTKDTFNELLEQLTPDQKLYERGKYLFENRFGKLILG